MLDTLSHTSKLKRPLRILLTSAEADSAQGLALYDELKNKGHKPWYYKKDAIGLDRITAAKEKAVSRDVIVVLLSSASDADSLFQQELRTVIGANKNKIKALSVSVISMKIEECKEIEILKTYGFIEFIKQDFSNLWEQLEQHAVRNNLIQEIEVPAPTTVVSTSSNETSSEGMQPEALLGNILAGILVSAPSFIISRLRKDVPQDITTVIGSIFAFVLVLIISVNKRFRKYRWVVVVAVNILLFAILFLTQGEAKPNPNPPPTATLTATFSPIPATSTPTDTPTITIAPETKTPTPSQEPTNTITQPTIAPTSLPDAILITVDGNMRYGPSLRYDVIKTYNAGDTGKIVGKNLNGDWIVVEMFDGKVGWISSTILTINVDLSSVPTVQPPPSPTLVPTATRRPTRVPPTSTPTNIPTDTPTVTVQPSAVPTSPPPPNPTDRPRRPTATPTDLPP